MSGCFAWSKQHINAQMSNSVGVRQLDQACRIHLVLSHSPLTQKNTSVIAYIITSLPRDKPSVMQYHSLNSHTHPGACLFQTSSCNQTSMNFFRHEDIHPIIIALFSLTVIYLILIFI